MHRRGIILAAGLATLLFAAPADAQIETLLTGMPARGTAQDAPADKAAAADTEATAKATRRDAPTGPCATPRAAVATLLDALQPDSHFPTRAARCLDASGLAPDGPALPALAVKLKQVLDARGLWVDLERLPDDPDHVDGAGAHRVDLFPGVLTLVYLERQGERWVFPADVVARIPAMYRATFPLDVRAMIDTLPSWMRAPVAGARVWQLVGVFLLVLLALIVQKLVVWATTVQVRRLAGRGRARWTVEAVGRAGGPLGGLVMAGVFWVGFPLMDFPVGVNRVVLFAARVLSMASVVWLGYRMADVLSDFMMARAERTDTKLDDQLVPLVRKSLKVLMVVIGGLFILQNLHVDIGSLLAGLGLGGLAFALAAKDTVANLFGSVMIFVDRPFQIGDWVRIGDIEGNIEEVGFRSTRIRTFYNSLITFPNARLMDAAVDNLGARRYRRYSTVLSLTYDTPPDRIEAFCEGVRQLIRDTDGMRKDYFIVEFKEYGAHSLDVMVYCFMEAPDWAAEMRIRTQLNLAILRLAKRLGVAFAFPTRTIEFASPLPPMPPVPPSAGQATGVARDPS